MRLTFKTDDLPARERSAFWHDAICRDLLNVTSHPLESAGRFRARLDLQTVGRFKLADIHTSRVRIERNAGNLARGASDCVLLYQTRSSSAHHYEIGAASYAVEPGDICLVPMDRRYSGAAGPGGARTVLIPNAVIGPLLARRELTQAHHFATATPWGRLLRAGLDAAAAQLAPLSDAAGDAVLGNLAALAAVAVNASDEGRATGADAARAVRLSALQRYMRRHRTDPLLDPARAAAGTGMSARQVHLLFQPTGHSFSEWLTALRLAACKAELEDPSQLVRSVADVAFGQGFNSLSVFYRAFAAAYAASPGEIRAHARPGVTRTGACLRP